MTRTEIMPLEKPSTPAAMAQARDLAERLPRLQTERLTLRAPELADFEAYAQIACSPRGEGLGGPFERKDAWYDFASMVGTWLLRGHGAWTVVETETGTLLGFVVIGFEPGDQHHELGYMMLEDSEGHGYATEAAKAARRYAQDTLNIPVLDSYILAGNAKSIALAERLGATYVGELAYPEDDELSLVYRHPNPAEA